MNRLHHWFTLFAKWTAHVSGHPLAFVAAVGLIIVWAVSGPIFGYSDTWQLVINTGTTIVTFLMVFLIQNTQNRDTGAIQTKLDELIRSIEGAHNASIGFGRARRSRNRTHPPRLHETCRRSSRGDCQRPKRYGLLGSQ